MTAERRPEGRPLDARISLPPTSPTSRILERLSGVRRTGRGWVARCPAHDDRHASLSVAEGADGRVLIYCHSGCNFDQIVGSLGLSVSDLFPDRPVRRPTERPLSVPFQVDQEVVQSMLSRRFTAAWELAKELAPLHPDVVKHDLGISWEAVDEVADPVLVWNLASLIRGIAILNFSDPSRMNGPAEHASEVRRAVGRLLRHIEVERRAA